MTESKKTKTPMSAADKRKSDQLDFIAEEKFGILEISDREPENNTQEDLVNGWAKLWVKTGYNEFSCILMPKTPRTYRINRIGKIRFCMEKGMSEEQAEKFFELKIKKKWYYLDDVANILKGSWAKGLVSAVLDYKRVLSREISESTWWANHKRLNKSELIGFKSIKEMVDLINILTAISGYTDAITDVSTIEAQMSSKYKTRSSKRKKNDDQEAFVHTVIGSTEPSEVKE